MFIIIMNAVWSSKRKTFLILISAGLLLTFLSIGLLTLILGNLLLALLVFACLVFCLLRMIGRTVMYPGANFYSRSEIELQFSRDLSAKMVRCFNAIHAVRAWIAEGREDYDNCMFFQGTVVRHLKSTIHMFSMFQDTLSERKKLLLKCYRELEEMLERKQDGRVSIAQMTRNRKRVDSIVGDDREFYCGKYVDIIKVVHQAVKVLNSFAPPNGMVSQLKYRIFAESLYEIRFGFFSWESEFSYQLFHVKTTDGEKLQSAIIHNFKQGEQRNSSSTPKRAVLFCNPNGSYIQFFAFHQEVANYIKQGYRVILWNYRGYGQSSGTPSLGSAEGDAYAIYRFYSQKQYKISVVHGYSIGGVAAVGLLKKIAQKSYENPSHKVESLIVDRSFSSISQISNILGNTLSKVAKVLYWFDDVNISELYEEFQGRKMIIWDSLDQIIPEFASVKMGLFNRKIRQYKQNQIKVKKNELNQQVTLEPDICSLAEKLQKTLRLMLLRRRRVLLADKNVISNSEQHRQTSMSTTSTFQDSNYSPIIQSLAMIDGAGVNLLKDPDQLQVIIENNPIKFKQLCESFVFGLFFYGSCLPLSEISHDRQKIKQKTKQKLQILIKQLQNGTIVAQKENIDLLYSLTDDGATQIRKNLYFIFSKIRQIDDSSNQDEESKRFGLILPTSNGHNNSITHLQMLILNSFLKAGHSSLSEEVHS